MFNGRRFCIPKFRSSTLQQTTRQWRHWWFLTTSCFGVTNHGQLASLWLVGRIGLLLTRSVHHLAEHPFGSDRWLHHPRWVGWLVRYLDVYLFYVYVCYYKCISHPLPCSSIIFIWQTVKSYFKAFWKIVCVFLLRSHLWAAGYVCWMKGIGL